MVEETAAMLDKTVPTTTKLAKAPRIRVRVAWTVLDKIKKKMRGNLEHRLRQTVFGHYLDLESVISKIPLLLCVARHQVATANPSDGITYVPFTNTISNRLPNSFRSRIFPGIRDVKQRHVEYAFDSDWAQYDEDNCLRLCLLMLLELGFKGTQCFKTIDKMVMNLVDDLQAWNNFPWGSYL
ncbi:hypothetical protein Hanom_Chr11g01020461 [Helianthus anomalus]